MSDTPIILPDDPAALKAVIARLQAGNARIAAENMRVQADIEKISATLRVHEALVQALQIQIARLKKQKFGASSERIEREIEQLELALEHLEIAGAAAISAIAPDDDAELSADEQAATPSSPRRLKPLVADGTPRERIVLDPGDDCPHCGGTLRLVGEDVSEILELISARLKLIETARLKKSCRRCEKITQLPAPSRPMPRSMVGPGLLAHVLVSKFDDHLPLYRQNEIFARMGAGIPASTLVDWCGQGVRVLEPLVERIRANILASDRLHADDTPVRVLDPSKRIDGIGKGVKEGRIWAYVRDDRPWGSTAPPGAAYFFSVDRKGEHPQRHLAGFSGILQADAYSGFKALYAPDASGKPRIREAACWAHLRRDFFDVHTATKSEIAREALDRIGDLYDIERQIKGQPRDARLAIRQTETRPKVQAFKAWSERHLTSIPGKSDLAKAFRYALNRWNAFTLFLDDGRVAIDNNAAERAIKPVVIGRKNFLFAGSDAGGETLASAMTIVETAKFNGLDPQAYLADIFARIHDHKINRIDELLPWNWKPVANQVNAA
jgi:transposase